MTKKSAVDEAQLLVLELRNGTESGIRQLYSKYGSKIISFVIKKFCLSTEDAEELLNDLVFEISKRIESYNAAKGASFKTWVFDITNKRAIDLLKSKYRKEISHEMTKSDEWWETVADHVPPDQAENGTSLDQETVRQVDKALSSLSVDRQEILRMSIHGMQPKEIAERMGKTTNFPNLHIFQMQRQPY